MSTVHHDTRIAWPARVPRYRLVNGVWVGP